MYKLIVYRGEELPSPSLILICMFVAIYELRALRHCIKHSVQKRRPQVTNLSLHRLYIVRPAVSPLLREKPERKQRNIWVFVEDRLEELTSALPHDFP